MPKRARCYYCMAYEGDNTPGALCLLLEKYIAEKGRYGNIYFPVKKNCRPKTIKEYCQRAELTIERMRVK